LGFSRAGFTLLKAVDSWDPAAETYRQNLGNHIEINDITATLDIPDCLVIAGGPPCQGFSSAGMRREYDSRNSLVGVFARIVARVMPAAFVFENVEGFLTASDGHFVIELLDPLIEAGYRIHLRKINAANYGVPQHRKRVIVVGGLGWNPSFPAPTHTAHGSPGARLATQTLPLVPSIRDAFSGLPPAVAYHGTDICDRDDHKYRLLSGMDLRRAELLHPGQTMRDLPDALRHESYHRRANRRVIDGTPTEHRGGAPAGMRRLRMDEPSKSITGGAISEFLHPEENRNLTLRECARIQTFPDNFLFVGTRSQRAQLIGNAVPPLLAEQIARTLLKDLAAQPHCSTGRGALLSFIPTLSNGSSPALAQTTHRVLSRFAKRSELVHQGALWD
jgi:DNA (cytosine-5)-methyltransferase 1